MFVVSQGRCSFARRRTSGRHDRVLLRPGRRPGPPGSQRFVPRLRVLPRKERARRHSYHHFPRLNLSGRRGRRRRRQPLAAQGGGREGDTGKSGSSHSARVCWETRFPRGSGCSHLRRCGLARGRDLFPPSPPLHPSTRMLGRSVCDFCPLLYRTGNVPPPAFFGSPLFLLSC